MTEPTDTDTETTTDVLIRTSQPLDIERQKQEKTDSWTRAVQGSSNADVDELDEPGRYNVRLPDGASDHDALVVQASGEDGAFYGACDCDGYGYHGTACAHLCTLIQLDVFDEVGIPQSDEFVATLKAHSPEDVDDEGEATAPDGVEQDANLEDAGEDSSSDADQEDVVEPDVVDDGAGDSGTSKLERARQRQASKGGKLVEAGEFAGALEDVPDQYVMTLDGDVYIRRQGYAVLAHHMGLSVESEIVTWASSNDLDLAEARAVVTDGDGGRWTGTGTALLEEEDLAGAAAQLNELAETRAITRALSWATGAGMSAAEMGEEDQREAATDGGVKR